MKILISAESALFSSRKRKLRVGKELQTEYAETN